MDDSSISAPETVPALIAAFGGPSEFARVIGKGASTAGEMKRTRSIRVEYWPAIVTAAAERGIPGVTLESLALMNLSHTTLPEPENAGVRS